MRTLSRKIICDFETSGTSHLYDQPITFSAKVYENGFEIDSINTKCKMNKSILVSPTALMVNNYPIDSLSKEQTLREMMFEIHAFFQKHAPSSIIAYNSRFDFNFAHSHYFQSLASNDWFQWKTNGNYVIDALELLRSIYLFSDKLTSINILPDPFGSPKFNLDFVASKNGIFYSAHEAENDVKSLRDLYGLMLNESEEIETIAHTCAIKKKATQIVCDSIFFCTGVGTGPFMKARPLVPLSFNKLKSAVICADISMLQGYELNSISSWDIFLQCKEQRYGNSLFIIPLNKSKLFFRPEYHNFCKRFGNELSLSELCNRAKKIRGNHYIKDAAADAWAHIDNLYGLDNTLESTIYSGGFCNPQEAMFINEFNSADWSSKWALTESNKSLSAQNRVVKLAKRIIFEHNEELIPDDLKKAYYSHLAKKLFNTESGIDVPWTNLPKVLDELEDLKTKENDKNRLADLRKYYDHLSYEIVYSRS